jgi:hypothetical protein
VINFGDRGQRLWTDLGGDDSPPAERVLLEEICRLADRLDVLDRVLTTGGDWLSFEPMTPDGTVVKVVITGVLSEARQQQATFKALLAELRQMRGAGRTAGAPAPRADQGEGVPPGVVDFGAFAATRSPKATG